MEPNPLGNLPAKAARMWEHVYESATERGIAKSGAAAQAWCAVKRQYRKKGNRWVKRKKPLGASEQPPGCTPFRKKNPQEEFDVYLDGRRIDTVFWTGSTADEVRKSLIEHDGYDGNITVTKVGGLAEDEELFFRKKNPESFTRGAPPSKGDAVDVVGGGRTERGRVKEVWYDDGDTYVDVTFSGGRLQHYVNASSPDDLHYGEWYDMDEGEEVEILAVATRTEKNQGKTKMRKNPEELHWSRTAMEVGSWELDVSDPDYPERGGVVYTLVGQGGGSFSLEKMDYEHGYTHTIGLPDIRAASLKEAKKAVEAIALRGDTDDNPCCSSCAVGKACEAKCIKNRSTRKLKSKLLQ